MKTMKVRPVLVETSKKSRICHLTQKAKDENWAIAIHEIEVPIILDSINYDILLISLDDRDFKEGDTVFSKSLNETSVLTYKDIKCKEFWYDGIFKVIANQRQFSQELLEKLVEEYNNGGMNDFEIEMNDVTLEQYKNVYINIISNGELVGSFHHEQTVLINTIVKKYNKPKLNNACIIPINDTSIQKPLNDYINQKHNQDRCIGFIDGYETAKSETVNIIRNIPYPIIYTEEDVKNLFKNWIKLKSDEVGLDNLSFDEWFETVKKK